MPTDHAKNPKCGYGEQAAAAAVKIDPDNPDAWELLLHSVFHNSNQLEQNFLLQHLVEFDVAAGPLLKELTGVWGIRKPLAAIIATNSFKRIVPLRRLSSTPKLCVIPLLLRLSEFCETSNVPLGLRI